MCLGTTLLSELSRMLVCIWFGLCWVSSSFFDHYIQSSKFSSKQPPRERACARAREREREREKDSERETKSNREREHERMGMGGAGGRTQEAALLPPPQNTTRVRAPF